MDAKFGFLYGNNEIPVVIIDQDGEYTAHLLQIAETRVVTHEDLHVLGADGKLEQAPPPSSKPPEPAAGDVVPAVPATAPAGETDAARAARLQAEVDALRAGQSTQVDVPPVPAGTPPAPSASEAPSAP